MTHSAIGYNSRYWLSIAGIVQLLGIIFGLGGFISLRYASHYHVITRGEFYCSVALIGMCYSLLMFVLNLFRVCERFLGFPWLIIEMSSSIICTFLCLVASAMVTTLYEFDNGCKAATFFGFASMSVFGFNIGLKFYLLKARSTTSTPDS